MVLDLSVIRFDLRRPCGTCPFLRAVDPRLHLEEISSRRLERMAPDMPTIPWACHSTTTKCEEGRESCNDRTQHCAGALIVLEKQGTPSGPRTFVAAIDEIPIADLDLEAPTFDSLDEMHEAYWLAEADEYPWRVL